VNKNILYIAFAVVFVSSGCFSSTPKKSSSAATPSVGATGQIIKESELKKGGTLVILPFKAGVNAAASQKLDRVSLMVVKGMIDYLSEERTPFKILTTQDQGVPDLVIDGYINNFSQPGKVKRWVMQSRKAVLSVDGYMEIAKTKERVLVFQHHQKMSDPKKDGLELAYRTGQDLGRFIVEALQ
jgi:hypothetical protein